MNNTYFVKLWASSRLCAGRLRTWLYEDEAYFVGKHDPIYLASVTNAVVEHCNIRYLSDCTLVSLKVLNPSSFDAITNILLTNGFVNVPIDTGKAIYQQFIVSGKAHPLFYEVQTWLNDSKTILK